MFSRSSLHQAGRYFGLHTLGPALVLDSNDAGAGDAGAPASHTALFLDRLEYLSGKLSLSVSATLAQGQTATISSVAVLEAGAVDGVGASAYDSKYVQVTPPSSLVLTGGAGGTTETGVVEVDVDLAAASVAISLQYDVEMSRADAGDRIVITPNFYGAKRRA